MHADSIYKECGRFEGVAFFPESDDVRCYLVLKSSILSSVNRQQHGSIGAFYAHNLKDAFALVKKHCPDAESYDVVEHEFEDTMDCKIHEETNNAHRI
mgnify:CR=1 FL=1